MPTKFASLIFLFLLSIRITASAESKDLSEQARVSIIILEPTQTELYSAFGHCAFRITDPLHSIDIAFDYGVFDFNQPNFYLNFTKGKLYYKLGAGQYEGLRNYYFQDDRTFRKHELNLPLEDKQKIFDFLIVNLEPENVNYYYNYCYDNCATRMRDVLYETLGEKVSYDLSYAKDSLSYRDLMDRYLDLQPWGDFGIDLCLGSQIDATADGNAYMYMPEFFEKAILSATVNTGSTSCPLVSSTETINVTSEEPSITTIRPFHFFIGVFFIVGLLIHRCLKYRVSYRFIDVILFGVTGFLGFFLLFLWFGTDHLSERNYNLLWAMPLNLISLYYLLKKNKPQFLRPYFIGFGILQVLVLISWEFIPQDIHSSLIPLVLALALRSFYLGYELKQSQSSG